MSYFVIVELGQGEPYICKNKNEEEIRFTKRSDAKKWKDMNCLDGQIVEEGV